MTTIDWKEKYENLLRYTRWTEERYQIQYDREAYIANKKRIDEAKPTFLYILRFRLAELVKIGYSCTLNRIVEHMNNYDDLEIDLAESYIISCNNASTIKELEKAILKKCRINHYLLSKYNLHNRDGYTEIRESRSIEFILSSIEEQIGNSPEKEWDIVKGINVDDALEERVELKRLYPYSYPKL